MLGAALQTTTEATSSDTASLGLALAVSLALLLVMLIAYWKVFTKLGLPGWMGVVPIVNVYMIFKARGDHEPVLWVILMVIPCINIVALWFLASDTAELFGKGTGWKVFLFLVPGLSHLVLGFGSAQADTSRLAPGVGLNQA